MAEDIFSIRQRARNRHAPRSVTALTSSLDELLGPLRRARSIESVLLNFNPDISRVSLKVHTSIRTCGDIGHDGSWMRRRPRPPIKRNRTPSDHRRNDRRRIIPSRPTRNIRTRKRRRGSIRIQLANRTIGIRRGCIGVCGRIRRRRRDEPAYLTVRMYKRHRQRRKKRTCK